MNKQTLSYHTRLHDWYRSHCIQQEKHQQQQHHHHHHPTANNNHNNNAGKIIITASATDHQPAKTSHDALKAGSLSTDKIYTIDEWCSDVNRSLFCIKKKESSPLFRKCRLSAASTSATSTAGGRPSSLLGGGVKSAAAAAATNSSNTKNTVVADPRRIKSAEVFTRTGHWAKQHKPVLKGGELLPPKQQQRGNNASERGVRAAAGGASSDYTNYNNSNNPEFCVRNSSSKENNNISNNNSSNNNASGRENASTPFPRVNHDSLNVRTSAVTPNNNNNNNNSKLQSDKIVDKSVVLSSQFIPQALVAAANTTRAKTPSDVSRGQKVKTVTVNYVINNLVKEENNNHNNNNDRESASAGHHSDVERAKNAKNLEETKRNNRIFSASQRSVKTEINSSALGGDEEVSKAALNAAVRFCEEQDAIPTFCNACSGIYSGNAPPPPTPATCANCVHGISVQHQGKSDVHNPHYHHYQEHQGPSHAQIQKEFAQKMVRNEKVYSERITSAKIELKMSETRLTEDSLHYHAERQKVRNADAKLGFSLPNTFDDLGDERNISFQDDDDDDDESLSNGNFSGSNDVSMSSTRGGGDGSSGNHDHSIEKRTGGKRVPTEILIQTYSPSVENNSQQGEEEEEGENTITQDIRNDDDIDDEAVTTLVTPRRESQQDLTIAEDANNLKVQRDRRGSRRQSLSYTYKPEVSSISTSNNLLRVLSIDDCKMAMRYNPHKVLEEHQVAEDDENNPMVEMVKRAMGKFGADLDDIEIDEKDSQVAMRLSQNSSNSITSLKSSSANNATIANKIQYKILFGPDHLNRYNKNLRPKSACLSRAFETLIHDRTVMQRIDRRGSRDKARNARSIATTTEGPKYKIINTALKREMGNVLQAHRQKLLRKYEQQKMGVLMGGGENNAATKTRRSSSRLSESTLEKSLSLDSLPSVKKGILKNADC